MYARRLTPFHRAYDGLRLLIRHAGHERRDQLRVRAEAEALMATLRLDDAKPFNGTVLVDGLFDNANYWLRLSMVRGALATAGAREVGLIGGFNRASIARSFAHLGIRETARHADFAPLRRDVTTQARHLAASTAEPRDILQWDLPDELPASILYDGFLNRQRRPQVDVRARDFVAYLEDALMNVQAASRILDHYRPDLLIVSHPFNFSWGPLVWGALRRNVDVIWLFGLYGTNRFVHMTAPEHITALYDQVGIDEIAAQPEARRARFRDLGRQYLDHRMGGRTDDIQAQFAFQRAADVIDRQALVEAFGWDPTRPVIGIYASNWFDWPHQLGMTQFTDFHDWTRATVDAASKSSHANWLIKPHPLDEHFGGVRLDDVIGDMTLPDHVRICDRVWNNRSVLSCLDALVTYHGTVGIEFAAQGGPVLLPDRGKYERCGFARVAASREDYLELLKGLWWQDMDLDEARANAEFYAGFFFCAPSWQRSILQGDDNLKDANVPRIMSILRDGAPALKQEMELLASWFASDESHFHRYKMFATDEPELTNIIGQEAA